MIWAINISSLKYNQVIKDLFPMHDKYALLGQHWGHKALKLRTIKTILTKPKAAVGEKNIFLTNHLKGVEKEWRHFLYVPSRSIRDYFGEQIAYYFTFCSYYT